VLSPRTSEALIRGLLKEPLAAAWRFYPMDNSLSDSLSANE